MFCVNIHQNLWGWYTLQFLAHLSYIQGRKKDSHVRCSNQWMLLNLVFNWSHFIGWVSKIALQSKPSLVEGGKDILRFSNNRTVRAMISIPFLAYRTNGKGVWQSDHWFFIRPLDFFLQLSEKGFFENFLLQKYRRKSNWSIWASAVFLQQNFQKPFAERC